MKKRKQIKEYRDKETSLRRSKRLELMRKNAKKRLQREDSKERGKMNWRDHCHHIIHFCVTASEAVLCIRIPSTIIWD